MSLFIGSGVAIVTPFKENGIDLNALENLLNFHLNNQTDAIIICGTTGEGSTMSDDEKRIAIKTTVEIINKKIPVIAGVGSNDTKKTLELSKYSKEIGADGLLVITPYYNKTSKKGLFEHFKAVNDTINLPIMAYNVPSRTGMNITPAELKNLSTLKNIVAIKEASGDISQAIMYRKICPEIDLYSGNDDQIVPFMSIGAKGVITVLGNILPEVVHNITHNCINGDYANALKLQLNYLNITNSLFIETNPIPVKTALNLMGKNAGLLRMPLVTMEEENLLTLKNELINIGLIK